MAREQGQVDGEAGLGHRLGQRPEGLGVAGEAVEDEHAVGPPSARTTARHLG